MTLCFVNGKEVGTLRPHVGDLGLNFNITHTIRDMGLINHLSKHQNYIIPPCGDPEYWYI
jgi:hypothetical protein